MLLLLVTITVGIDADPDDNSELSFVGLFSNVDGRTDGGNDPLLKNDNLSRFFLSDVDNASTYTLSLCDDFFEDVEEDVEEEQVQRHEDADHAHFQQQNRDEVFAHAGLYWPH